MSIRDLLAKINPFKRLFRGEEILHFDEEGRVEESGIKSLILNKFYLTIVIILTASLSFGVGRLSKSEDLSGVEIRYDESLLEAKTGETSLVNRQTNLSASPINALNNEEVIVSKNSSKYHFPYCTGAKQIKEENKITFPDKEAAERAGYSLAGNCKPR